MSKAQVNPEDRMSVLLGDEDKIEYRKLSMPTKTQLHSVVKGDDRYRPRPFPWIAVFAVGVAIYWLYWIFTS